MRRVLRNMKLVSSLKVNFDKCYIFGVNVNESRLGAMAEILGCNVGYLPFAYLGIKVRSSYNNRMVMCGAEVKN